mgnify:CR=1 FL=1
MRPPETHAEAPPNWRLELALVASLWALVTLPYLGGARLWDIDEGNNTEASREMRATVPVDDDD